MKNIYFISDTHFGHSNNLKYSNRPFSNIREHDETLITNWNNVVTKDDDIYHLGDFGFSSKGYLTSILEKLNGNKYLIKGNHDRYAHKEWFQKYFKFVKDIHILKIQKTTIFPTLEITLCHYAMRTWSKSHWGSYMLYGHSHGNLAEDKDLSFDVGVDCWNYKPINLLEIYKKMEKKNNKEKLKTSFPIFLIDEKADNIVDKLVSKKLKNAKTISFKITKEIQLLQSEISTIDNLLKQLPESSIIEKTGLEYRKNEILKILHDLENDL